MKTDSSALGPDPYGFVGGVIGWRLGPATSSSDGSTLITVNSGFVVSLQHGMGDRSALNDVTEQKDPIPTGRLANQTY